MVDQVPTPRPKTQEGYTLSWRVYRALNLQPYSASDRMLEETWEATNLWEQVLVWGTELTLRLRWMPSPNAIRFRASQRMAEVKKERDSLWAFYLWLRNRWSYHRQICDLLYSLRQNLEESNGSYAR